MYATILDETFHRRFEETKQACQKTLDQMFVRKSRSGRYGFLWFHIDLIKFTALVLEQSRPDLRRAFLDYFCLFANHHSYAHSGVPSLSSERKAQLVNRALLCLALTADEIHYLKEKCFYDENEPHSEHTCATCGNDLSDCEYLTSIALTQKSLCSECL